MKWYVTVVNIEGRCGTDYVDSEVFTSIDDAAAYFKEKSKTLEPGTELCFGLGDEFNDWYPGGEDWISPEK